MEWCITFAILVLAQSTRSAQMPDSREVQKPPSVNCTEYFSGYDDTKLDIDDILGLWHRVYDYPEYKFCATIETITEEHRKTLAAELKAYTNKSELGRFTLIARGDCPDDNDTGHYYFLLSKTDDRGIFDAYFVHRNKSLIDWKGEPVIIKTFQIESKQFLGVLPCRYVVKDQLPDIYERDKIGSYTTQELKDLQFVFNNNKIEN